MRRYFVEVCVALALFFACAAARRLLLPAHPEWRMGIYLAPIVPVLLIAAAMVRGFVAMDEYRRRNLLHALAAGAFLVGLTAAAYPFARLADVIPVVPYGAAWPVMALGWLVFGLRALWRDKEGDVGAPRAVRHIALNLGVILALTIVYWLVAGVSGLQRGPAALATVASLVVLGISGCAIFRRAC
jgi:hypothetical protein